MAKCLFTDAELDADTKEEHTIQRSVGGRVKSVGVSSSSFNERSGQRLDPYLCGVYAEVMRVLCPVLPSEARSGSVEFMLPDQPGRWKFNDKGQMVLAGTTVLERDPTTNRPRSAIAPDMASLEPMFKQLGSPPVRRSEVLPPSSVAIFQERAVLHWRIEVAALKAVLLTFDHLLRHDPARFTRTAELASVRQFVRSIVESNSDNPNIDLLAEVCLGVQYEPKYLKLYADILTEAELPTSPFGHTLIVSADQPSRTLDAVFWAFGTDPHAFRLTTNWQGESFTYVMTNGILLDTEASEAVKLPRSQPLGTYNNRRSMMKVIRLPSDTEKELAGYELAMRRRSLYQQAVDYVERNCDESVQEQLSRLARLNENGDHRLSSAAISHLITLFAGKLRNPEAVDAFVMIVAPIIDPAVQEALGPGTTAASIPGQGWAYWLALYRKCLDELYGSFGLPGHIFQVNQRAEVNARSA